MCERDNNICSVLEWVKSNKRKQPRIIHDKCTKDKRLKLGHKLKRKYMINVHTKQGQKRKINSRRCVLCVCSMSICVCARMCVVRGLCVVLECCACGGMVDLVVVGALPKSKCDCLYVWLLLLQFRRFSACFTFVCCPHSKRSINRIQRLSPSPVSLSSFSSQPLSFPFITLAMLFVEPVIPCCCWLRALGTAADAAAGATVRRLLLTACC